MGPAVAGGVDHRDALDRCSQERTKGGAPPHLRGDKAGDRAVQPLLQQLQGSQVVSGGVHGLALGGSPHAGHRDHQVGGGHLLQTGQPYLAGGQGLLSGFQASLLPASAPSSQNLSSLGETVDKFPTEIHNKISSLKCQIPLRRAF